MREWTEKVTGELLRTLRSTDSSQAETCLKEDFVQG